MSEHDHAAQQHPKTFDEVIARGFPLHAHPEPMDAPAGRVAPALVRPSDRLSRATVVATRRSATGGFDVAEQEAFKAAVTELVRDGTYRALVADHMDMRHMMHGTMGVLGLYRFLAWHRRYLVAFERALQRADATLRPGAPPLGVPYWRWQDPFPAWLDGFLPANDPASGATPPPRKNADPPSKASASDIDLILNGFAAQRTGVAGENDFTRFTYGLEGWGTRPDGSRLPAHNHGHAWIGGIMNNTSTSPTDPAFWLHHAQVDRLWESWRRLHPAVAPPLVGAQRVMDPWPERYDELLSTTALGFEYDSLEP